MTEETTTQETVSTESAPPNAVPEADLSFREHVKWRTTGELPAKSETEPPPAAAEPEQEPPAKTEPDSGTEETQQEEEEEEAEGEQSNAARRRRGARERRIDKLTRENEQLRQQLTAHVQPPAKSEAPPGKPRLENYETLEDYQEALTDWNITQREAKRQADAEAKAAADAEQKLQTEWDSRQKAARKAHPDYDDVIESVTAPEGPGVFAARQAMLEDDAGAEILYHLAKHPAELKRIAALPPIAAVREIGRLSAHFSPPSTANGKQKFSAAPKPPPPSTRPGKTVSDSIDDPAVQADFRRYAKARAAMKDK